MPRPKPRPGHTTVQVTLSVPEDIRDEFVGEAGAVYGAQSLLFRKMLRHWQEQAKWRERYEAERTRRAAAERRLQRILEAVQG